MRRYMPAKPEPNGFKFKNGNPYIGKDGNVVYSIPGSKTGFERDVCYKTEEVQSRVLRDFSEQIRKFDRFRPKDQTVVLTGNGVLCDFGYNDISFPVGFLSGGRIVDTNKIVTTQHAVIAFNTAGRYIEVLNEHKHKAPLIRRNKYGIEIIYPLPANIEGVFGFPESKDAELEALFNEFIGPVRRVQKNYGHINSIVGIDGTTLEFQPNKIVGQVWECCLGQQGVALTFVMAQAVDAIAEQFNRF